MSSNFYSSITPEVQKLTNLCIENGQIDPSLYAKYDVKRGLRDISGKGVLAGLTEIADVKAYNMVDGKMIPCKGELYYRGYNVEDIVRGFSPDKNFGFEEITYLLMFGKLPNQKELDEFIETIGQYRTLPPSFVRDVIMKSPSKDIMNALARGVLMLYSYDERPDDVSIANVVRQCLQLVAQFPLLAVYSYQAYQHYHKGMSLIIHTPDPKLSTAENILHLLRPDSSYTELEAKILDIALVLHAEHGGGNNSTFTTHVVSSSGTDTYSAIVASLGSLKGPKHGGANIKVTQMFDDLKQHVSDWEDEDALKQYLRALLHKEAFDKAGLIYGMGHAVYSISDPRAQIFKRFVQRLSVEKGCEKEYELFNRVERLSSDLIKEERKIYKGVSANVDFYSGFVYRMLGLPMELFTPIFAIARISGWSAHRIEELINEGKIIRPAYRNILEAREYINMKDR
ncbi:MAG TPA: citrate/2-methylcitrate synthase [Candidatus Fimimorpha faecalis]|uniref:Citrate synthase n=1 Tax=Candidatus Fimimorpha faecalis TaxID=2840824 RepID=A0A9D1ECR9_9FIRM|nr:citrate/2-methylcitrate synthase [Candidatus Fimimorpha faecalis]